MKRIDEFLTKRISEKCGVKAYPVIASEQAKNPLIVYAEESYEAVYCKQGLVGFKSVYVIDIFADDYDKANDIQDDLIEAFEDYSDELVSVCRISGGSTSYGECFIKTTKLEIHHRHG